MTETVDEAIATIRSTLHSDNNDVVALLADPGTPTVIEVLIADHPTRTMLHVQPASRRSWEDCDELWPLVRRVGIGSLSEPATISPSWPRSVEWPGDPDAIAAAVVELVRRLREGLLEHAREAEFLDDARPCADCAAAVYDIHAQACDVAVCLHTGGQRLSCDGVGHDCGDDVWDGLWPGVSDCRRLGWYAYFGPDHGETGWVRCDADHPAASEDLNRLAVEAVWDSSTRRREPRA